MTHKSAEYYAMERNAAKQRAMLAYIDNARSFNYLRYAESVTLSGAMRSDDRATEIVLSGELKKAVLDLCAAHSIAAARAIHCGEWEANDFEKAAKV